MMSISLHLTCQDHPFGLLSFDQHKDGSAMFEYMCRWWSANIAISVPWHEHVRRTFWLPWTSVNSLPEIVNPVAFERNPEDRVNGVNACNGFICKFLINFVHRSYLEITAHAPDSELVRIQNASICLCLRKAFPRAAKHLLHLGLHRWYNTMIIVIKHGRAPKWERIYLMKSPHTATNLWDVGLRSLAYWTVNSIRPPISFVIT